MYPYENMETPPQKQDDKALHKPRYLCRICTECLKVWQAWCPVMQVVSKLEFEFRTEWSAVGSEF